MPDFCHLHCHSQYSLLDGAAGIDAMFAKAKSDGMKAVAITDHGNMFGAFNFFNSANKHDVTPIIGCEVYVVEDRYKREFKGGLKDKRYHQLLLAKDPKGYVNLSKICSTGFVDGLYRSFPRVDMEVIEKYHEGLIATTCCIGAQVPQTILRSGEAEGEKVFKKWLDIFGEDYYIELQRHQIEDIDGSGYSQEDLNQILLKWSKKYNVKVIATNDSHYVDKSDFEAHDVLLCLQTGNDIESPNRFRFANDEFYFKTKAEMGELFKDVPEALDNTLEIVSKIQPLQLKRDILLPNFKMPEQFKTEDEYLEFLSYEGAKVRYGLITQEIEERIQLELKVIRDMGFAGYFLIVQDFIDAAKKIDVAVGPGRGSAAGSVVAYLTGITNIDPIKYNLLFERFLNPERVSMPDIDIDFDDEGRQKVIDYVVDKYGKNQVAQIITYGTMAARSAVRDVGRVLKLPLSETDKIAKLIPEGPKVYIKESVKSVPELKALYGNDNSLEQKTLKMAEILEGSVRHRGIHAAGIIIAPDDLMNYIPVCTAKDSDLWVTQFDGKVVEDAGMLKMDFLGLKTLTIIKDAITNIHYSYTNEEIEEKIPGLIDPESNRIDPDLIPLDDLAGMELFQRGETVAIFQFESEGMQMYLKDLKPTSIEDIIAMNALYRPGPMDNIPEFINRKHGKSKITYPHEWLEGILKPTYGIMVYQEQIMQAAQIMAGYSLGSADILRRAMGKKKASEMSKQRVMFKKGAAEKNVTVKNAEEIFDTMEKFASYGFNRSHSAAYSVLAFQTAFLKAHYPAHFMASVLTHNMNDIKQVNFFLSECNRLGINALIPDVNESVGKFTVNKKGEIRFGLNAVKGVGSAAVENIVEEREKDGPFTSPFDLAKRVNLRSVNKKCFESLCKAGAFDELDENLHRSQLLEPDPTTGNTGIELLIKFGQRHQQDKNSAQISLFGEGSAVAIEEPKLHEMEEYPLIEKLNKEREVTGIFLSDHPLNRFKAEMESFCNTDLENLPNMKNADIKVAAIVAKAEDRTTKTGRKFGSYVLEDLKSSMQIALFNEDYLKMKHFFEEGEMLYLNGRYQTRWSSSDQYEFKVTKVCQLREVKTLAKQLVINIQARNITTDLVDELETILKENPGPLNLRVFIHGEEHIVEMFSSQYTLSNKKEVLELLDEIDVIKYKLSQVKLNMS